MRIIRFEDLVTIPWKNGGGITREIAVEKDGEKVTWRLSMADVSSDGPFSNFAGLMRILTVVEGGGMRLVSLDETIEATLGKPVTFDGAKKINSELIDGPLRDFNVMFDPKRFYGEAEKMKGPTTLNLETGLRDTYAIFGLAGTFSLNGSEDLCFGDTTLIKSETAKLVVPEKGSVLMVKLTRVLDQPS